MNINKRRLFISEEENSNTSLTSGVTSGIFDLQVLPTFDGIIPWYVYVKIPILDKTEGDLRVFANRLTNTSGRKSLYFNPLSDVFIEKNGEMYDCNHGRMVVLNTGESIALFGFQNSTYQDKKINLSQIRVLIHKI